MEIIILEKLKVLYVNSVSNFLALVLQKKYDRLSILFVNF
jgi:hypothetical protein